MNTAPWTLTRTPDGIEIVYGSAGYDTTNGYALRTGGHAKTWRRKTDAVKVARALGDGWAAVKAHTRFMSGLWVVHRDNGGGFLTTAGYALLRDRRAAEHYTRTFELNHRQAPYRVNSRGMTGYRDDYGTSWCCTCGNGGFGEDRDRTSARHRAAMHRNDPAGFPGAPWTPGTVIALRAERALPA